MCLAFRIIFLSCLQAEICVYLVAAAILDYPLPVWSNSVTTSPIGKTGLQNLDIAIEMLFLCALQAEIKVLPILRTPSCSSHFRFGCSMFIIHFRSIRQLDSNNIDVAVRIALISWLSWDLFLKFNLGFSTSSLILNSLILPLKFHSYLVYKLRYICLGCSWRFGGRHLEFLLPVRSDIIPYGWARYSF